MSRKGTIVSLQYCPGYRRPMEMMKEIEFIQNLGIKNDAHARENSERQVLLIEQETLDALGLQPGIVKENITTSGIELMTLREGTRLQIGDTVVLEITKPCAPCSRMDELRPGLRNELAGRRGMLARVISGGVVHQGYSIQSNEKNP